MLIQGSVQNVTKIMNAEPRRIAELKSHLIFGTQNEKKTILEEMP
jgi:hypothetical protein